MKSLSWLAASAALSAAILIGGADGASAVPIGEGTGAGACSFGPTPGYEHGISNSIDCAGVWVDDAGQSDPMIVVGDDTGNEALVNGNGGFAGFRDWDLVAELAPESGNRLPDGPNTLTWSAYGAVDATFEVDVLAASASDIGVYDVSSIGDATEAAIVLLASNTAGTAQSWAIYQLNTSLLTGNVSTILASELSSSVKMHIHSVQLYLRVTEVPVPAAAPMLLTALGGLAFLRRRRAATRA
ncbi:VPLPA-CTERM sorting domain-containing protein [Rhodovulum sp. DZ06]|uniref:VPLPA-CTERM sorting domain-containing protein n=1 Tax=Rhodovulum sp. DZ06 TaxID=3425126 RepID=UPI003D354A93